MRRNEPHPNIIFYVSHDTGRRISPYGVETLDTPAAERVAQEGMLFEQAFATAPQCSPSRSSLFTGCYPQQTGVMGLTGSWAGWALSPDCTHIADYLSRAGYETALIGLAHEAIGAGCDGEVMRQFGFDSVEYETCTLPAKHAASNLEEWLNKREQKEAPFFAEVCVFETHTPYDFDGCQPDDSHGVSVPPYLKDSPAAREMFAQYQGSVAEWDRGLGMLLDLLDRRGLTENTILVVTTDHGLPMPRAKTTLYDPGIETLLMLRYPGRIPAAVRSRALISNVDILPTVLELAGLELADGIEGQSFAKLMDDPGREHRDAVFAQKTFHGLYDPMRCIRTERYKYIRNFEQGLGERGPADTRDTSLYVENREHLSGMRVKEELYDLDADPLEHTNLAQVLEFADIKRAMMQRLLAWMRSVDDPILSGTVASPFYRESIEELTTVDEDSK